MPITSDRSIGEDGDFVSIPVPTKLSNRKTRHRRMIDKLEPDGDCYFVPCDGDHQARLDLCRHLRNLTRSERGNGKKFTTRICQAGVQWGVGVWRLE